MSKQLIKLSVAVFFILSAGQASAWLDKTHVAIARAAGYEYWFNAAGADITKTKAGDRERKNHYFNNSGGETVDSKTVIDQAKLYDNPDDKEGHLYGAIIASIRNHDALFKAGKYAGYHMAFAAHYIGDLSVPNHNIPYMIKNGFPGNNTEALKWHLANDAAVEDSVLDQPDEIAKRMYAITLRDDRFEEDLAAEISRIANLSRILGEEMRAEQRIMTREEAFVQIGHSASLLKAVLKHYQGTQYSQ